MPHPRSSARRSPALLPVGCFLLGAAAVALLPGRHPVANAAPPFGAGAEPGVEARVAALEARLQELTAERSKPQDPARLSQGGLPQAGRFFAAALHLQAAIASPRPWLREYELMAALAPAGTLARPLAEVLSSHAARGVPTEFELRERFAVLAPLVAERAPHEVALAQRGADWLRGHVASIGLAAPPAPSGTQAALEAIADQLRHGNLGAAAADAAALPAPVQPLLAGWLAQARARLAVEQAIRETLLLALSPGGRPA